MNQLRISIPEPCTVGWHTMTTVDESHRHCGVCDRVLTDFSKMSDEELVAYFQKGEKLCGRFAAHQLNRPLIPEERKSIRWKAALLLPALLFGAKGFARQANANPQIVQQQTFRSTPAQHPAVDPLLIEGVVTDSITGEPLIDVMLFVKTKDSTFQCMSDIDGRFRIRLTAAATGENLVLEARCVGYTTAMIPVTPGSGITRLVLSPVTPVLIEGEVIAQPYEIRHHGFFYRLFHWRKR